MSEKRVQRPDERDDVATLVRLAGKRRPVAEERAARVRAAAHSEWQGQLRRRARQRYIWLGATLAAAASIILAFTLFDTPQSPIVGTATLSGEPARVELIVGAATVADDRVDSSPQSVEVGAIIPVGSNLVTTESSRLALRLPSGHSIRLDISTHIRLLDIHTLRLDRGAVYVESRPGSAMRDAITVETPFGAVREIGTQFEIRLDRDLLHVRVREGRAVLDDARQEYDIPAGTAFEIAPSGASTSRAIPTHGAEWKWIAAVAPMPDFAGRSAKEFLDWVARERGWTLQFSDPAAARSAEGIVLGSLGHLGLDQALDAVLPTCLMAYRVEDGVLWVAPDDSAEAL